VTGFILFRIFDIWKPFPIRQVDKNMGGGMGIMFDDVLAGIYALLTLQAIYYGMDYFNMINV
jgi:phosphatidylglycerophosphatase A